MIAFAVFVIAIIWAIIANNRHKKTVSTTTTTTATNTPALIGQPVTSTAPVPTATAPTAAAKKPAVKTHRVIIGQTPDEESTSEAFAAAGTNADGSAWATAEAN